MQYQTTESRPTSNDVAVASKSTAIPTAIKSLEEEITHLGSVVDRLISRLEPILRNEPRNDQKDGVSVTKGPSCQLSACIDDRTRTLVRLREAICDIDNRLEL